MPTQTAMDSPVFERCPLRSHRHNYSNYSRVILLTRTTSLTSSLAEARSRIKMKGNSVEQFRSQPFSVSNHLSRPPEPSSAFLHNRFLSLFLVLTLFISLALGSLVADETSRTKNWGRATRPTRSQHGNLINSNYIQHRDRDLSGSSGHKLGHGHHSAEQNQQEQNQLRYLVAKTATMPQLIGRVFKESSSHPMEGLYSQLDHHSTNHMSNQIVGYHPKRNHHPEPVQRADGKQAVPLAPSGHVQRRKPFFGTTTTEEKDLERSRFSHSNRFGYDFDSLNVELGDFDHDDDEDSQIEDSLDDVDDDDDDDVVVDIDDDAGNDGLDDDDDEKEDNATESAQTEATGKSYSIPDSDGDRGDDENEGDDDEQNSIQMEETTKNTSREKNRKRAKTLYTHSAAATRESRNHHDIDPLNKINSNVTEADELEARSLRRQLDGPLGQNRNWRHEHVSEAQAKSGRMVTSSPFFDQLEMEESREQVSHHLRASKQQSQPSAPYQSPVVVSISDNSFVSASPISVGMNSDEQVENSKRFERSGAPRYSHIIASPKNELSLHGKRYWHESHIQMIQEEPNELHRGNINSAIIAILFGIGVTGTLIMIVSIKMRSIRERVAYKGRRRSLVPDTDFLINTIPM